MRRVCGGRGGVRMTMSQKRKIIEPSGCRLFSEFGVPGFPGRRTVWLRGERPEICMNAGERSEERASEERSLSSYMEVARSQFQKLTGVPVESVSGVDRIDGGWKVTLEAVELRRVPDTVSLLATYTVDLDQSGEIQGYRRVSRYTRGRVDPV